MKQSLKHYSTLVIIAITALFLVSCSGGPSTGVQGSPFIGGEVGVVTTFEQGQPPAEVYDAGQQIFNVQVKLENKGEHLIPKDRVRVTLGGFKEETFQQTTAGLTKTATADLLPVKKLANENIQAGGPVYIDFPNLNYNSSVTGSQLSLPFQVSTCYEYQTTAQSTLCVRKNILTPTANGVCTVGEDKQAFTSGGPLQMTTFKTAPRSQNTIQFTFTLEHKGTGTIHKIGSSCSANTTGTANKIDDGKILLKIDTGLKGLTCTGMSDTSTTGTTYQGVINYRDAPLQLNCVQTLDNLNDYVQPVKITADYDYQESITTTVTVKSAQG